MSSNVTSELVETLLSRAVSEILQSLGEYEAIDKAALFHLNRLAEQYIQMLAHRALACTRAKRRTRVSYEDLELGLLRGHVSTGALEDEVMRIRRYESTSQRAAQVTLETCADKVPKRFEGAMDRKMQAQLLGPELNGKRRGIPPYMMEKGMLLPALPPLYTHQRTPVFPDRVNSELEMRQRVLQETQMVEASLWRLTALEEEASQQRQSQDEEMLDVAERGVESDAESDNSDAHSTNVMSRTALRQAAKRKRMEAFSQVWRDMSFGEEIRHRPANVETVKQVARVR